MLCEVIHHSVGADFRTTDSHVVFSRQITQRPNSGALTHRGEKGCEITHVERDENLTNHDRHVLDVSRITNSSTAPNDRLFTTEM